LWSGEQVSFRGKHVVVDDVAFGPVPVQRPRVPVWIGGYWPNKAPMRRAARSPLRPFSAADGRDRVHSCLRADSRPG
jgi:alkanesulfonate monooxygenase SsuD/methylene tetrahydromethanopterin reductase-like flavin-dependent oxidoreductase (luciferase family)